MMLIRICCFIALGIGIGVLLGILLYSKFRRYDGEIVCLKTEDDSMTMKMNVDTEIEDFIKNGYICLRVIVKEEER